MRAKLFLLSAIILLICLSSIGTPSAAAENASNSQAVGINTTLAAGDSPGSAVLSGEHDQSGQLQNKAHPTYECSVGTCTCKGSSDCGIMGADHVCKEGTFSGTITGGTCTEKAS